ncbi:WbqC family protein [Synechococcus sp. AH-224-G16]|nr:WbqC family protein [Synechococcus sp. AH-224-G16]
MNELIINDDMQYTRRDWHNRNKIKTPQGFQWLTVPVVSKGKCFQSIRDTEINGSEWALSHWNALQLNYGRAPFFSDISEWIKTLYTQKNHMHISELNRLFIVEICNYLKINTLISCSWDYKLIDGRIERLADLCSQAGGDEYISGPAAKDYIDEQIFLGMGLKLT